MKLGATMQLKSGGPQMTVVAVSKESRNRVCCGWFSSDNQYRDTWFHTDALKEVGQ